MSPGTRGYASLFGSHLTFGLFARERTYKDNKMPIRHSFFILFALILARLVGEESHLPAEPIFMANRLRTLRHFAERVESYEISITQGLHKGWKDDCPAVLGGGPALTPLPARIFWTGRNTCP